MKIKQRDERNQIYQSAATGSPLKKRRFAVAKEDVCCSEENYEKRLALGFP